MRSLLRSASSSSGRSTSDVRAHRPQSPEPARGDCAGLSSIDRDIEAHVAVLRADAPPAPSSAPTPEIPAASVGRTASTPSSPSTAPEPGGQPPVFFDTSKTEMADLGRQNLRCRASATTGTTCSAASTRSIAAESSASSRPRAAASRSWTTATARCAQRQPARLDGHRRGRGADDRRGAVAFIGLLDRRRVLAMTDANSSSRPPARPLPRSWGDPEPVGGHGVEHPHPALPPRPSTASAPGCRSNRACNDCRVIALTSPSSGDGKTSMTIALGMSFAAGGSKTLLIEGDVVGGGLTGRLNAKVCDDLAKILYDEGVLTPDRLDTIRRRVREQRKPIEDVLLESGWVNEVGHRAGGGAPVEAQARPARRTRRPPAGRVHRASARRRPCSCCRWATPSRRTSRRSRPARSRGCWPRPRSSSTPS